MTTASQPEQSGNTPELTPTKEIKAPSSNNGSGGLVRTGGSFANFLAPLNPEKFSEVLDKDVFPKLKTFHDTLSMLDNVLDSQSFDAILNDMLQSITLKTGELLGADRTTIFLLDEDRDELWSTVAASDDGRPLEIRIPTNKGIAGEVATNKKIVNIPYDFYDDPRSRAAKVFDQKNNYRTYNMLALPLLEDEEEVGEQNLVAVVQLINKLKSPHDPEAPLAEKVSHTAFTEEDIKMFEEFAPSIRLILKSSQSFYRATQKQRAADSLIDATKSLSRSNLDLDATLKTVMDEAKKLMNAARSTLWLLDHDNHDLWTKITLPDGTLRELRVPIGKGYAGKVAEDNLKPDRPKDGVSLNISYDLYNDPDSETSKNIDQTTGFRTCSLLCMPVFNSDDELIGVTQLVNKEKQGDLPEYDPQDWPTAPERWKASFNRSDLEFMRAFNIQAGVALQNAKLFARVKQQEQLQRDILRSLTNGVISTDHSGNIIAANEKALDILGLKDQPIEGKSVSELINIKAKELKQGNVEILGIAKENFRDWFQRALKGQEMKDREQFYPDQELLSHNGEEHTVNISINSIADVADQTNVYGALVVMDDISDEKRLKSTMYRYMTQELAEQLLESGSLELGGDRKDVSILFSDIRSYTSLTEKLEAEEVVGMLNEYFETMVEAIFQHKGTLDKYIGDAIMAVFGSPLPLKDHAWKSVQTAIAMRHRLTEFNQRRKLDGKDQIHIGIGINSGSVISGNIGSSKRMEFTAIGDGVNLSSRLEGASKQYGCDIIISENTYEKCKNDVIVRELDQIRVKGKSKAVSIYELVSLKTEPVSGAVETVIEHYHQGRQLYVQQKFAHALDQFAKVLQIDPHNKAAYVHMQRCQYFFTHPPEHDWDGVWNMTTK